MAPATTMLIHAALLYENKSANETRNTRIQLRVFNGIEYFGVSAKPMLKGNNIAKMHPYDVWSLKKGLAERCAAC